MQDIINIPLSEIEPGYLYRFQATEKKIEFKKQFFAGPDKVHVSRTTITGWAYCPAEGEDPYFIQDDIRWICLDSMENLTLSPATNFAGSRIKLTFTCMTDFLFFIKKLRG